jgi:SAM-dependent methyltransferase
VPTRNEADEKKAAALRRLAGEHPLRFGGPFEAAIDRLVGGRTGLRVLDAGSGWKSVGRTHETWHVVGIDISADQLARNVRLNERVLGDLQTHAWAADSFDMIVCWDVLEHLPHPIRALTHLVGALKPGGILVIAVPNLYSLKGLLTKFTPFAFHEWFYRNVLGSKQPMSRQFPTVLRREIAPSRLRRFAMTMRLDVAYYLLYEGSVQKYLRWRHALANVVLATIGGLSRVLSSYRLDLNLTDCIMILQNNSSSASQRISSPQALPGTSSTLSE